MCSDAWQKLRETTEMQKFPPLELISGMGGCAAWVLDLSTYKWTPRKSNYWYVEMYFGNVEKANKVQYDMQMNIAHSVVPHIVQGNAAWIMKKLINAAPMHWTNWTKDGERTRWAVLVELLGSKGVNAQNAVRKGK